MAKNTTVWNTETGTGEFTNANEGDYLKTSSTEYFILATGGTDKLLIGSTAYTPKAQTAWNESDS